MIIIPETIILKNINLLLKWVRVNYETSNNKENSYLYKIFKGIKFDNFDFYNNSLELLINSDLNKKSINVNIGFNLERSQTPTIHIIIPDENKKSDGIGFDEGYELEDINLEKNTYSRVYTRTFSCTYTLLITSHNMGVTIMLTHLLKSLLISGYTLFELENLQELDISTTDVQLQQDLIPMEIFHRMLKLSFWYTSSVPSIDEEKFLRDIQVESTII